MHQDRGKVGRISIADTGPQMPTCSTDLPETDRPNLTAHAAAASYHTLHAGEVVAVC